MKVLPRFCKEATAADAPGMVSRTFHKTPVGEVRRGKNGEIIYRGRRRGRGRRSRRRHEVRGC